jgi:DNA-binding MarR family transcriptional regulator
VLDPAAWSGYGDCVPTSNYLLDDVDAATEVAVRLRGVVARVDRLLARELVGSDLTRTQVSILFALVRRGEHRLGDLAEREGVNPTMLSRVVAALEAAGLVQRLPDPQDRRAALVAATAAGARLYERLQRERASLIAEYVTGLSPSDAHRLTEALPVLEGLADHLQERGVARERRR